MSKSAYYRPPATPPDYRSGETAYNKKRIIQGQMDTDLSDKGINQALLCGRRLQYEKYTHAFSSDLKRAYKTCELILQQNKVTTCSVSKDKRLRERNFGSCENRPVDYFAKAAKDARVPLGEYTPPRGESNKEVRQRAIEFFQTLCQDIRHQAEKDAANENSAASIKRRRHTGSFCSTASSDVFTLGDSPTSDQPSLQLLEEPSSLSQGHSNSGSTSSTSGYSSTGADGLESPLDTSLSPSNLSPVSPASQSGQGSGNSNSNYPWEESSGPGFQPLFDRDIRLHIQPPLATHLGCPNVSLSPIFEHRLSSVSSISSGRNSSFDETDLIPALLADVLVVSHGGFIKQTIVYFVDELGCKVPGTRSQFMQSPYNTAISKFAVTVGDRQDDVPRVTCLSLNDRDHLLESEAMTLEKAEDY